MKSLHALALLFICIICVNGTTYAQATEKKSAEPLIWIGPFPSEDNVKVTVSVLRQNDTVTFKIAASCGPEPDARLRIVEWEMGKRVGNGSGCYLPTFKPEIFSRLERDIFMLLPPEVDDAINRTNRK